MGSTSYRTKGTGKTVGDAFNEAQERAWYEFGHDPYSGTIGTKSDFFEVAVPSKTTAQEIVDIIEDWQQWDDRIDRLAILIGKVTAQRVMTYYDDKWGPAVALRSNDTEWFFLGHAPC